MQKIKVFYRKYQTWIENGLFPVLLILYPFVQINQGIDVSDTAYSLSNFAFFGEMKGTWMTATFLANVLGSLLMKLPFGDTLLGIYCYTTLLQSATAVLVYASMRRRIPAPVLFLGEIGALGLCWCPSTILYNYLTYLLLMGGMLLLYRWEGEGRTAAGRILRTAGKRRKSPAQKTGTLLCRCGGAAWCECGGAYAERSTGYADPRPVVWSSACRQRGPEARMGAARGRYPVVCAGVSGGIWRAASVSVPALRSGGVPVNGTDDVCHDGKSGRL